LGTREFFVVHHTDCGMQFFTNDVHIRCKVREAGGSGGRQSAGSGCGRSVVPVGKRDSSTGQISFGMTDFCLVFGTTI
jgi:hypothetical protein